MSIEIDGKTLTINKIDRIGRHSEKVYLSKDAISKIIECREMVERKIDNKEIVYGINTGIGEFSETILDDTQLEEFQKFLIYNFRSFSVSFNFSLILLCTSG